MENIPAHEITRPLSVLNERAFLIKKSIHEQFGHIWNTLVHFNEEMTSLRVDNTIGKNWKLSYDCTMLTEGKLAQQIYFNRFS
jgi:hypothetical protein